jgi:hypothetical protein
LLNNIPSVNWRFVTYKKNSFKNKQKKFFCDMNSKFPFHGVKLAVLSKKCHVLFECSRKDQFIDKNVTRNAI